MFFCAGNIAETLHRHRVSELNGIGRRMPWTMAAFTVAALGMIGVPPLAGFVSKWYLSLGAHEAHMDWVLVVLTLSSLLNAAYFLPIVYAAWFRSPSQPWPARHGRFESDWRLLVPTLASAALVIAAGLLASTPFSPLNWAQLVTAREYLR
jgi:formate hydrogenlyase subunit 3/multisubunit Na+/H+ antiporter MnhD subunit